MTSQPEEHESPLQPAPPTGKPLTPNQEVARLRRERRNAKIQGGGSARLEAITRLSGRRGGTGDDGREEGGAGTGVGAGVEAGAGMIVAATKLLWFRENFQRCHTVKSVECRLTKMT